MVSPNGPVLTDRLRPFRRVRERKQRKDQLGEAVGFLEMRVAGEDERIDADRAIVFHPRRNFVGRADQRGPGSASHQADAGPQVRADHELVAAAAVQRAHAALADRVHAREHRLRLGDRFVVEMRYEAVGRRPGFFGCLADDDVEPDAEAELAPVLPRLPT